MSATETKPEITREDVLELVAAALAIRGGRDA